MHEFQEAHGTFSEKVERLLMQLVILGLVALVLVQTLHINSAARRMINFVEAREGVTWNEVTAWQSSLDTGSLASASEPDAVPAGADAPTAVLTVDSLTAPSLPAVRLLVDGQEAGTFAQGRVTHRVRPGQTLVIDATAVKQPLKFRVSGNGGLQSPAVGTEVETRGNVKDLGVVR